LKKSAISLLFALSIDLALLAAKPVSAGTPTPAATSTPIPSPGPASQQVHTFRGQTWLHGCVSAGPVVAKISDVICSELSIPITPADSTVSIYTVRVFSAETKPGCGREGEPVTFEIEGYQAQPVALWHAGGDSVLDLIAGAPFARFYGALSVERPANTSVVPFVGGQACGYDRGGGFVSPETMYEAVVFFDQQQRGCGVEGSEVTFKLVDAQGNILAVAEEKGVWHPWYGVEQDVLHAPPESPPQRLDLTFVPVSGIRLGNVGDGSSQGEGSIATKMAMALTALGLAGLVAGATLRKRAGA